MAHNKNTPWVAGGSKTTTATWVKDSKGKTLARMVSAEEDFDTAKLMAAAPNLLLALKVIIDNTGKNGWDAQCCAMVAKQAIKELNK